jgi:hypothetical protein
MSNHTDERGEILDLLASALDIPDEVHEAADAKYVSLSEWLRADHLDRFRTDASIYPQGSMRLGTAVMPINANGEYDVDVVYCRDLQKGATTQETLKEQLGQQLRAFLEDAKRDGLGVPSLEPGRRCWTLTYAGQFHMDVLPAIPDVDAASGEAILIPDRDLREWQHSNPKGYASWFGEREAEALVAQRAYMAKEAQVNVESIPTDRVRTPLRQAVRLLKRHRDLWCEKDPSDKPTSIIVTTLAALAYSDERSTASALQAIASEMPNGIERRDGVYWIANPASLDENFADRWRDEPRKRERFFAWLERLRVDLSEMSSATGIQRLTTKLCLAFGASPAESAVRGFADVRYAARTAGNLRMESGSGRLGGSGSVVVPQHTNYGKAR